MSARLIWIVQILILLNWIYTPNIQAQVVINEVYSPSTSDWVELFNNSSQTATISGYILKDTDGNQKIIDCEIPPTSLTVISFSNRLNKDGDAVWLLTDGGVEIDRIGWGQNESWCAPVDNQSIGRFPDGTGNFTLLAQTSEDGLNSQDQIISCPSATPIPQTTDTPTPKPTNTPKPTAIFTPTPKLTTVTTANTPVVLAAESTRRFPLVSSGVAVSKKLTVTESQKSTTGSAEINYDTENSLINTTPSATSATSLKPLIVSLLLVGIGLALLSVVLVWQKVKENAAG
ncbi:hypothetical protein A2154_03510 [Candidatus Gottesmanbacteria bacterium RBG_16_43_7]|uniref:LTD domain-containing protein n=1 Tax=Candidatus Gottesmanbacteria bacterium RBG_16_43_7 TaxID=1798373 RepID=A0A1F5Z791_9BACT|nr:MAG: hypothetical protein A2154_03510 [Candidatus Gottesmanbacteria bacterium RBG_16_43_7]